MNKDNLKNATRTAVGSLTQLAAVGPQDVHIHYGTNEEKAQSYQFQSTYRQHTHFALDCSSVYSTTHLNPEFGKKLTFTIPFEKQHLISQIIIKVKFPQVGFDGNDEGNLHDIKYKDKLGYRLIENVEFKMNNQIIESYSGQYLYLLHKLETSYAHKDGIDSMMSSCDCTELANGDARTLYIPLHLWYSRTMKQFFPHLALSNQKLTINILFASLENLVLSENDNPVSLELSVTNNGKVKLTTSIAGASVVVENISKKIDCEFYIDYVVLDAIERDLYLKSSHMHVYNQSLYQSETIKTDNEKIELHFNTPIKQLLFVITDNNDNFTFYKFGNARLLVGGTDTMSLMNSDYYSLIQDYYHNLNHPDLNIHSYSFALNASISEHNGSVHFGKLPTKILEINGIVDSYIQARIDGEVGSQDFTDGLKKTKYSKYKNNINNSITRLTLHIYARGYNILHTNQGYGKVEFKA